MRKLLLTALFSFVAAPAQADDPQTRLGTLRVHAWLGKPSMPPIALTRGPLQQIIEGVEPEGIRPSAQAWEDAITRDRRLARAADEALDELQRHYRHQMVVRPGELSQLRVQLARERHRLQSRLDGEAADRAVHLRQRESHILDQLQRSSKRRKGVGRAASQLLVAEIQFARHQHTHRTLMARWQRRHDAYQRGELAQKPTPPMPFLKPTVSALERVSNLAPDRLTRERAAQLLAVVLHASGDLDAAVRTLQAALKSRVSWTLRAELHNRLGDLLLEQGRFAGAARRYGALKRTDGSWYVRARLGLAWSRHRLGDDDGALAAVKEVRARLAGLFDGSAQALMSEADLLYAQLLADSARALPGGLSLRLKDVVRALRQRHATMVPVATTATAAEDRRLAAIADRIGPLRTCYRRLLASSPAARPRGVIAMTPGARATLVGVNTADRRFRTCIGAALRPVVSSRGLPSAILAVEFEPEPPTP